MLTVANPASRSGSTHSECGVHNLTLPYGDETKRKIAAGDDSALLNGLIAIASSWMRTAGVSIDAYRHVMASTCFGCRDPQAAALLAAGVDILRVLEASPQGRKAIADFCGNPLLQDAEGE